MFTDYFLEMTDQHCIGRKDINFTYFVTSTSKMLIFFICNFLHVLDYHLVEGFSLTPSSIDDPEDNRCSLMA